jgi:oxygen-independent coproporphyrinogen-3 oxidase
MRPPDCSLRSEQDLDPMSVTELDLELLKRFDGPAPRYTSYPTAQQFGATVDESAYRAAACSVRDSRAPLSLYVHLPFCSSPCFYCGCNRVISRSQEARREYLRSLLIEVRLQSGLFDRVRRVRQLHLGGGTPTVYTPDELSGLIDEIGRHFTLDEDRDREFSIEIDPRTVDETSMRAIVGIGFTRVSLGVQDFDPAVQRAVNRVQPTGLTVRAVDAARQAGVRSLNIDLIYGLPRQTPESFEHTLDTMVGLRPDRVACYAYSHLPDMIKAQRQIHAAELPDPLQRAQLQSLAIRKLTSAGYRYIGMDHFALPEDELSRALDDGTLHRDFQGYSTRPMRDLVGLGVSAIGKVGDCYAQNEKSLAPYRAALDTGRLPIQRGVRRTRGDEIRGEVIQQLMCHGRVDLAAVEHRFQIRFDEYFAPEMQEIHRLDAEGLTVVEGDTIRLTTAGRLLMRRVAMVFDAHMPAARRGLAASGLTVRAS